jgi:Calcineurin-like phosphoesterase
VKAIVFGDLHLEQGSKIGNPDDRYGNTRMRDAERTLKTIAAIAKEQTAYLIFAGDLARTPRPGSLSERIVIDALGGTTPIATIGNHDYLPVHEGTGVHVVTRALGGWCYDRPAIWDEVVGMMGEEPALQIGLLPWAPLSNLHEQAPGDLRAQFHLAQEALYTLITTMSGELDPKRPSILVGHWTCGDDVPEFMFEPVLDPTRVEAASSFDVNVFAHYHQPGQVGARTWRVGPPLRSSFAEADVVPGYLQAEWLLGGELGKVGWHALPDRELVTVKLAHLEEWLMDGKADLADVLNLQDEHTYSGQIVRLTAEATPEIQAALLQREGEITRCLIAGQGAEKVLTPIEVTVRRPERERRSELHVDADPLDALREYLDREGVSGELRELVLAEAKAVIA